MTGRIRVSSDALELKITIPEGDIEAMEARKSLVSQMASQMAMQLEAMFGITGEIVEVDDIG